MPCTYTGSIEGDRALALQDALDLRERMLCALCTHLETKFGRAEAHNLLKKASDGKEGLQSHSITRWWKEHQTADKRRKR